MSNNQRVWPKVGILTAGHFGNDFYANFLPALLPFVLTRLDLSLTVGGLLIMVSSVASSVLQPVFGYFLDRSGSTWPILVTLPGSALFIAMVGLMPNLFLLFLCVICAGFCSAIFHPLGSGLLGRVMPPNKKGLAMSLFVGGGNFGFASAPAVVMFCVLQFGMPSLLWLSVPGILLTFFYYKLGLHRIVLSNGTQNHLVAETNSILEPKWYRSWTVLNLNLVMGLRSWMQVALTTLFPLWMAQRGMPPALAGLLLTAFLASAATGGLLGGWLGDRFGHKNFIITAMILCLPALFVFFTSPVMSWTAWVLIIFVGGALQGTMPSSIVWAQSLMPNKTAMASGMMLGLSFGLGGLGTALTAWGADIITLDAALLWTLIPYACAIPLAFFIPAEKRF